MGEERFHIAEWYGQPFHKLSDEQRVHYATFKRGSITLSKVDGERLVKLQKKAASSMLSRSETRRLQALEEKLKLHQTEQKPCPFKHGVLYPVCTKAGGVCSIRLYSHSDGIVGPVEGERGAIRALCPWRFHQDGTAFDAIGMRLLQDPKPVRAGEVGFLESIADGAQGATGEDVGRIDMILIKPTTIGGRLEWVAVEVQAVYFSGRMMSIDFEHLVANGGTISMPLETRRPDYRSSGVKRLMPQLQTKVPTLRRWGKKMVVVVDASFFRAMGPMERVADVSNADIVWVLVDFVEGEERFELRVVEEVYTTLESATLGLTGGTPVSQSEFEERILAKLRT